LKFSAMRLVAMKAPFAWKAAVEREINGIISP
jgi:hypothetical protein